MQQYSEDEQKIFLAFYPWSTSLAQAISAADQEAKSSFSSSSSSSPLLSSSSASQHYQPGPLFSWTKTRPCSDMTTHFYSPSCDEVLEGSRRRIWRTGRVSRKWWFWERCTQRRAGSCWIFLACCLVMSLVRAWSLSWASSFFSLFVGFLGQGNVGIWTGSVSSGVQEFVCGAHKRRW